MASREHLTAGHLAHLWQDVAGRSEAAAAVLPDCADGAASRDNLLAYAALREHDISELQLELSDMGLSSLGRLEGQVLHSVRHVLARLGREVAITALNCPDRAQANAILAERARSLLGRARDGRAGRIMVTVDAATAADADLVEALLLAGMDLVRINCAHDGPEGWERIVESVREAEARLAKRGAGVGRRCHISMDLGGPRLRTGPMPLVSGALRLSVQHHATAPRRGLLDAGATVSCATDGDGDYGRSFVLAVPGAQLADLHPDDVLSFSDVRGRKRQLAVIECGRAGATVDLARTAILTDGTELLWPDGALFARISAPVVPLDLRLIAGDRFLLSRQAAPTPGRAAVPISLPGALDCVEVGHRVFVDDGHIAAEVVAKRPDELELRVIAPAAAPIRLRAEKGLNFPDSKLGLGALTDEDRAALPAVARLADVVAMSFVHRPEDVAELAAELARLGRPEMGIVAKIETKEAIHNLVRILLLGLTLPGFGVMIARGDLAVEVGFENLALVQEDILCLCEAAHVPVIWATQVLESLARTGLPARAEITDANAAQRAECVMLNKGPHILGAVETLSVLLGTADRHRTKKREVFRDFTVQYGVFDNG